MTKQDSLAKASKELMLKEPFYGLFLIGLNKLWSNRVPTAGVCKHNINFQLMINEEFWESLSPEHHIGLLKHELLHIAFFHLTCLLYTSPSPRDGLLSRMPSSA